MECLGALARCGLADALNQPGTAAELAGRAELTDVELTGALLDLGVAHGLLRRRGERYRVRGARMQAVAGGRAPDVSGLAEEATAYDGPIYASVDRHLRGLPPQPYLSGLGDVIARASRIAEPVVGPWLAAQGGARRSERVLDVGCGTGVNLRWLAGALPAAELTGIDLEAEAVDAAQANVGTWGLGERVQVRRADLRDEDETLAGPWDLIVLSQNIYYWPVGARAELLAGLRRRLGPEGAVLVVTVVPTRAAIGRHLDLVLRVTSGSYRLPTIEELRADAITAGFTQVRARDLVPGLGMAGMVASG